MPLTLDVLPRGHEIAPTTFDLSPAWVDEYIAAVEADAVRVLGDGLVPPMAIAALAIRALLESTALPPGAVHAGQELRFLRPVRAGERLSARAGRAWRGGRQGWLLLTVDLAVDEGEGEPVMTGRARVAMPVGPAEELAER